MDRPLRGAEISVALTQGQARILSRHASGLTLEEVAEEEFVHKATVYATMRTIRTRLGARNNTQAALIAHAEGYLSDPGEDGIVLAQSPYTEGVH